MNSYGSSITINLETRTVEGMDVVFKDYTELLHAANMINFCGSAFRGICKDEHPFEITKYGGDIEVRLLTNANDEVVSGAGIPMGKISWWVVGVLATALGAIYGGGALATVGAVAWWGLIAAGHLLDTADTLSKICPTLNNDANKQKFRARLNKLPNLTQGNQVREDDSKSPLQPFINEVINELEGTEVDEVYDQYWVQRFLQAEQDPNNPEVYTIFSYKRTEHLWQTKVTFTDNKYIEIEWLDGIKFDVKEWIRVANLTNKIKSEYAGRGKNKKPFVYRGNWTTIRHPGLYIATKEWNINRTDFKGYQIIKEETLTTRYPKLYENIEQKYIPYLHTMRNEDNVSLWV